MGRGAVPGRPDEPSGILGAATARRIAANIAGLPEMLPKPK